jgi:hypothetical protein
MERAKGIEPSTLSLGSLGEFSHGSARDTVFALCRTVSLELAAALCLIGRAAEISHYVWIDVHCCERSTVTIIPPAQ